MRNLNNIYKMYSQKENTLIRIEALKKIIQDSDNQIEKDVLQGIINDLASDYNHMVDRLVVYGLKKLDEKEYFLHYNKINDQIDRLNNIPEMLSWIHDGFFDIGKEGVINWIEELDKIDTAISGKWYGEFFSNKPGYKPGLLSFAIIKKDQKIAGKGVFFDGIFLDALFEGISDGNELRLEVFNEHPVTKVLVTAKLSENSADEITGVYETEGGWDKGSFRVEKNVNNTIISETVLKTNAINDCRICIEKADFHKLKTKLKELKTVFPNNESEIVKFLFEISDFQSSEIKYGIREPEKINNLIYRLLEFLSGLKKMKK